MFIVIEEQNVNPRKVCITILIISHCLVLPHLSTLCETRVNVCLTFSTGCSNNVNKPLTVHTSCSMATAECKHPGTAPDFCMMQYSTDTKLC